MRSKSHSDSTFLNQIISTSEDMLTRSPKYIGLTLSKKVEIASFSIIVNENIISRNIEINPIGIYHSYLQQNHFSMTLEEYTSIIVAHEIGHNLCPLLNRHIKEDNEKELTDPYTMIIYEINAWKYGIPFIPEYINRDIIFTIAERSIQEYVIKLIGKQGVPVFVKSFYNIVNQEDFCEVQ